MKTIKRKAEVGERILITNVDRRENRYTNGDAFEVKRIILGAVYAKGEVLVLDDEYEVIIENETEVDGMINEIEARFEEAVEQAREAIEELRLAALAKGYEDARRDLMETKPKSLEAGDLARALAKCVKENRDRLTEEANAYVPIVSPQQQRDAIVEQAKKDVKGRANRYGYYYAYGRNTKAEFIVNADKRTVVVILRWIADNQIVSKGIAKCAPTDCFNAHIGRAISLRRALGLEVPAEYLSAPQATEVRVGDVIGYPFDPYDDDKYEVVSIREGKAYVDGEDFFRISDLFTSDDWGLDYYPRIIDDTRGVDA